MNRINTDKLRIGNREFSSRLFVGTGKFSSNKILAKAIESSGTEMVTVALRRVDLDNHEDEMLETVVKNDNIQLLPNTSGARDCDEAVRLARLSRAMGCGSWVKLEVTPDPRYLLPDPIETLKATEILVKEGFTVLPYINADPILAKRLEEAGSATVMPLGAPIGSNRGLQTLENIKIIIDMSNIPVVVDAGIGTPSHAAQAIEIGADAVLVNTAIAVAADPEKMALAFRLAVESAMLSREAGPGEKREQANASSPLTGFLR